MAERARGNIFYEIIIVILIIGLLGTILYPTMTWNDEEELETVCRTRMETIYLLEYYYQSKYMTYTDSVPAMTKELLSNPDEAAGRDSLIFWDKLVTREQLELLFSQKVFPEDMRAYIRKQFVDGKPIGNLGIWDDLEYKLLNQLRNVLASSDEEIDASLDQSVDWTALVGGEDYLLNILDTSDIIGSIRRRTQTEIRRGTPLVEARQWARFRPLFLERLRNNLETALREDVWTKEEEDNWEEERRVAWETEMNGLAQGLKDSLWRESRQRFWNKEKELIWKSERNGLWKNEGANWQEENTTAWKRSIVQKWSQDRKSSWETETLANIPDSLVVTFAVEKDSLWKATVDSLQAEEYDDWEISNQRYVQETIRNIWESERRFSWEEGTYEEWVDEKERDMDVLWEDIKEDRWNMQKPRFWHDEESKLGSKISAQQSLNRSVSWVAVLGEDRVLDIVSELQLPDNEGIWKDVADRMKKQAASFSAQGKTSALYDIGIVGLFRTQLLDSLMVCPLAHIPYHVNVVDTAVIKRFSIRCPIVDTEGDKIALKIDSVTKDTSEVMIEMPKFQRILGGGTIKVHGAIDEDGNKSWDKRGT